jgi:transposase
VHHEVIDNNVCEIAIKVLIRYRNNSRFYKTFYGANVGDAMMSLLHTAVASNVNPFDYLNALQLHANQVQTAPEKWLPWNYQDTLRELDKLSGSAVTS